MAELTVTVSKKRNKRAKVSVFKSVTQLIIHPLSSYLVKPLMSLLLITTPLVNAAQPESERINGELISSKFPFQSRYVEILGSKMHYIDEGEGEVVMFIHGNPTSSYLWRNVIPHVSKNYRTIAIDLIGMGKSEKPNLDYTYLDHRRYVNQFIETLNLKDITFVIHDWGSVLGMDYAMNHEENVKGVAFMEALLPPRFPATQEPSPESIFGQFRTAGSGEKLVLDENFFVEQMLPGAVIRELSEEEMNIYREPYLEREARKPTLLWPRELPMGGKPASTTTIITNIGKWMKSTQLPMLYFYAQGQSGTADYYVNNLNNIETHYIGVARHYLQEDHPESIGRAIHDWRRRVSKRK